MKRIEISHNEWNYLKDDGTYLLNEYVFNCWYFSNGFGRVEYNNFTCNFINLEGKKILKTNVNDSSNFNYGFAEIKINYSWYKIDKECNFYNLDKVSFKELYNNFPNMRSELIEIIKEYTYHDVNEYFNI